MTTQQEREIIDEKAKKIIEEVKEKEKKLVSEQAPPKKVKKKNYAIYFMFSFELELYAIQSLFDIFGPNTNHSLSKHLVRKSSYFINL